jgi:hypothetical protein
MTTDDSSRDEPRRNPDDGEPDPPFDEEAAWRLIVENYGERPRIGPDDTVAPTGPAPAEPSRPAAGGKDRLFDRSYLDALDAGRTDPGRGDEDMVAHAAGAAEAADAPAGRHDDEHFVPPEPPPVPRGTPARRLAWGGLFLPPLLMLCAVIFSWSYPSWVALGLVAAFVGGFVFLVATMPRDGDGRGDGAVV